jgi:hypothetical protein
MHVFECSPPDLRPITTCPSEPSFKEAREIILEIDDMLSPIPGEAVTQWNVKQESFANFVTSLPIVKP